MSMDNLKPSRHIILCAPRGFCAGVERAILIVERALEKFGAPVYVRHEIVHNKYVLQSLRAKGAIFVKELDDVPDDRPVIFSAHGVPKSVPAAAASRNMIYLDATCPLVSKVHVAAEKHMKAGRALVLIGHKGHPEVVGTMGQLPAGAITLIETVDDVAALPFPSETDLAYITQTTLSVDDTADIIAALRARYPSAAPPHKEDICYATSNRQAAVKDIAPRIDWLLVLGSKNSSNSNRLVDVARMGGCDNAALIDSAADIPWNEMTDAKTIGLTAGASAPEILVDEVIDAMRARFDITIETVTVATEDLTFKLPREVA